MTDHYPYIYDARLFPAESADGIVDGDSMWVQLDLGFYIWMVDKIRLDGVDTREIHFTSKDSEEYERGMVHKEFVEDWFAEARENCDDRFPVQVATTAYDPTGKYGRLLAFVKRKSDGEVLNDRLLEEFDDVDEY